MSGENITRFIKNNRLKLLVKPNSPKTKILEWNESKQALRVAVSAPADKNKANIEIIKFFTKLLKKQVRIQSGLASKVKVLKIED